MHGLPCAAFQHCFRGAASPPTPEAPSPRTGTPVLRQPGLNGALEDRYPATSALGRAEGLNVPEMNGHALEPHSSGHRFPTCLHDDFRNASPILGGKYPHIPRPSIVIKHPQDYPHGGGRMSELWEREAEDGPTPDLFMVSEESAAPSFPNNCGPGPDRDQLAEGLSRVRSIMAEPDYMDGDDEELIKPKKLINPVKTSRNHQDLHRELMMNQKRGLAPQNKPELQKVMERRKRDQVLRQQKEEQEAQVKHSDLELELIKRQQKLEQLELEQQKSEEEQENTPEFVKMKGNLRRTKQEAEQQE